MHEISILVGKNVRKFRLAQGLTQEQLAIQAGLNSDYVSRLELGKENPTVVVLHKIGRTLNINVKVLFE